MPTGHYPRKPFSEETKRKISEANKGKVFSKERRRKIGEASKGRLHTEEWKRKASERMKGHIVTKETREKIRMKAKGRKHSEQGRKNISEGHKGQKAWNKGLTKDDERVKRYGRNSGISRKGKSLPQEVKEKLSQKRKVFIHETKKGNVKGLFKKGQRPWNYFDGKSQERYYSTNGDDWGAIRNLVLCRDEYKCQHCEKEGKLHIHHIIPFMISFNNSLNNLITLCPSCHSKEDMRMLKERKKNG